MLKKIVLFACMLFPIAAVAQEAQKIAHFNFMEVIEVMPEFLQMNDSLQRQAQVFEEEMKVIEEEYQKKYTAFIEQQETMAESIKQRRIQEIQDLEKRAQTFQQQAYQSQQQLQQTLYTPIQMKILNAVKAVGDENKFAYIMNSSEEILLYISPQSTDATPLVKAKLGVR